MSIVEASLNLITSTSLNTWNNGDGKFVDFQVDESSNWTVLDPIL